MNPQKNRNKFFLKFFPFKFFLIVFTGIIFSACKTSDSDLIRKADDEALNQRAQLAKYLYIQVLQNRSNRDELRFRALEGLAEVSSTQLFDYPAAIKAIEIILEEFGRDALFRDRTTAWRLRAAQIYRTHFQKYERALQILEPLSLDTNANSEVLQEVAKNYLSIRKFSEATFFLKKAWDKAPTSKNCNLFRSLQMDMIQTFSLDKKCDQAIDWIQKKLPAACKPDSFSLAFEEAHCFESGNEIQRAIKIYEDIIKAQPSNSRAHFLLESIKKRQREKQIR
ncbi:MAG: hypothetical protein J0L93_00170 [Deltaproteobacteria bacterium]|nr:hypothetical protein [Deltaproteobacteria bacterium]